MFDNIEIGKIGFTTIKLLFLKRFRYWESNSIYQDLF